MILGVSHEFGRIIRTICAGTLTEVGSYWKVGAFMRTNDQKPNPDSSSASVFHFVEPENAPETVSLYSICGLVAEEAGVLMEHKSSYLRSGR